MSTPAERMAAGIRAGAHDMLAEIAPERTIEPLFDPADYRFGRYLESDPPTRQMLIGDVLPLDIVGLVASMGGVGKSVLLYQLAMATAAGVPWIGLPVEYVGGALYLAAEDDEHELHRRGRRILEHYEALGYVDRGAVSERLHVASRVAEDSMLTRVGPEGDVARTALVERLIAAAQLIPDLRLILLDPTSRFRGGTANAEEDATRYVEALEAVRAETGATVLASVHVRKASITDPGEGDQSIVRGSTALVDGVRWVATMQRLRRDAAPDYGLEPADADRYVRFELAKSNYTRVWPGLWLRREAGGVLVPCVLERRVDARREARADERYADVLDRLRRLLEDQGPMTGRRIERDYAGAAGVLGVGAHTVRSVISRAVVEGNLLATDDPAGRGGKLLSVRGGAG